MKAVLSLLFINLLVFRVCFAQGLPPVITAQPSSTTVSYLGSASFSVSAFSLTTLTFQWLKNSSPIAGATSSTYNIPSVGTNDAGGYSVQVGNAGGNVTSSTATLNVLVPPAVITSQPQNLTAIQGQTVMLSVTASSVGLAYLWRATNAASGGFTNLTNGGQISGANTSVLTISNVTTNNALVYNVIITNISGAVTSSPSLLKVIPPLLVNVQFLGTTNTSWPSGRGSVQTGSAILGATGDFWNPEAITYFINPGTSTLINGAPLANSIGNSNGLTLTVGSSPNAVFGGAEPSGGATDTGTSNLMSADLEQFVLSANADVWTVTVGGLSGFVGDQFNLVVYAGAPSARSQTIAVTGGASGGNTGSALITSSSDRKLSNGAGDAYQIFTNGILNGSNLVFTVNGGTAAVDTYSAFVNGFQLQVYSYPVITTQPASQTAVVGSTVQFNVGASGGALRCQWQTNGGSGYVDVGNGGVFSGATSNVLTITGTPGSAALAYQVVVANNAGSVTSAPANLTVSPYTVLIDCDMGSGAVQTGPALIGSPGDVWNAITTASGSLVGSTGSSLNGIGFTLANAAQLYDAASGSPTDSGTTNLMEDYAFGYNSSGFTPTVTASITGLKLYTNSAFILVIYAAGNLAGEGGSFTLTGASGGNSASTLTTTAASREISASAGVAYATFTGTLTNGTLAFISTENAGQLFTCVNGFQLELNPPPIISSQPVSQTNIAGGTVSFNVTAMGSPTMSYQWIFNGASISGATNASLTLNNVVSTNAGNYEVVITNSTGSITSSVATLTVYVPPMIISQPQNQTLAIGQPATFSVVAKGSATLGYQWQTNGGSGYVNVGNGGVFSGVNSNVLTLASPTMYDTLSYQVIVNNNFGSVTSTPAFLTLTNPVITLSLSNGLKTISTGCTLQISVPVGISYIILASTDLKSWIPVATNVSATGYEVYTDISATNYSRRFYRTVLP